MRTAKIERNTSETKISLTLGVDKTKNSVKISTGVGFLDHMLTLFAFHGGFDLELSCEGDLWVDAHHTTEDVGIALGEAFKTALGDKKGIARYGSIVLPMDEALVLNSVDLSGRAYLGFDVAFPCEKIGSFDTELIKEFFLGFCRASGATLHIKKFAGENGHHIAEACFKGFGRALGAACAPDARFASSPASTKGTLS